MKEFAGKVPYCKYPNPACSSMRTRLFRREYPALKIAGNNGFDAGQLPLFSFKLPCLNYLTDKMNGCMAEAGACSERPVKIT